MHKAYVLDTNVLLHDPNALFAFEDNHVVIPFAVIEEIDNQKKRQDEIGRNARVVSRELDSLRTLGGRLAEGIELPSGGKLTIELNHSSLLECPKGLDPEKYDNRILAVAFNMGRSFEGRVTLVTKDLNLRVKADVIGVHAEDFHNDKVEYSKLYSGVAEERVSTSDMDHFYKAGHLKISGCRPAQNQFFVLKSHDNPSRSALAQYTGDVLLPLHHADSVNWGIRALNKEQKFAIELLRNDNIKIVTLVGRAGTGKTLLALAVGLEKILEENAFTRLLVTRPVIPMGEDLGYLPGTKEEKLRPWMQPIYDNLEFLMQNCPAPYGELQDLIRSGTLELEALTYIRGRSIPRQFIICDEAQNLSPHMIKTLITRVGEDTKIVLTGDPEQIDHPYLDASSNGLTYMIERLKGEEIAGHVTLVKGERSQVAELGSRLL